MSVALVMSVPNAVPKVPQPVVDCAEAGGDSSLDNQSSTPCNASSWCGLQSLPPPLACGVLWYLHIPKAGGGSVYAHLEKNQKLGNRSQPWSFVSIYPDYKFARAALPNGTSPTASRQWNEIRAHLRRPRPLLIVHQHHGSPGMASADVEAELATIQRSLSSRGCRLVRATMLREPVSRSISDIMFHHEKKPSLKVKEGFCAEAVDNGNNQTSYVTCGSPEPGDLFCAYKKNTRMLHAAIRVLADFDVVGQQEDHDGFVRAINHILGWPANSGISLRHHQTGTSEDPWPYVPSPATRSWMGWHNQLDRRLYSHFCQCGQRPRRRDGTELLTG